MQEGLESLDKCHIVQGSWFYTLSHSTNNDAAWRHRT